MDPVLRLTVDSLQAARLHRSELRGSMAALEQALAGATPGRAEAWAQRVHVALVELSADLRVHVELMEGPAGLHGEVLLAAPRLAGAVRRLAAEHVEITRLVDELLAGVDGPLDTGAVSDVRERGVALLGRLVRHRQAGADLVFEAYQADIGGET
jgi:hypothetical protein